MVTCPQARRPRARRARRSQSPLQRGILGDHQGAHGQAHPVVSQSPLQRGILGDGILAGPTSPRSTNGLNPLSSGASLVTRDRRTKMASRKNGLNPLSSGASLVTTSLAPCGSCSRCSSQSPLQRGILGDYANQVNAVTDTAGLNPLSSGASLVTEPLATGNRPTDVSQSPLQRGILGDAAGHQTRGVVGGSVSIPSPAGHPW